MNFKDLYKSANDNIYGDRTLLDKIYSENEKRFVFNFKYATVCAAAVLVLITLTVYPKLNVGTESEYASDRTIVKNDRSDDLKMQENINESEQNYVIQNEKKVNESNDKASVDVLNKKTNSLLGNEEVALTESNKPTLTNETADLSAFDDGNEETDVQMNINSFEVASASETPYMDKSSSTTDSGFSGASGGRSSSASSSATVRVGSASGAGGSSLGSGAERVIKTMNQAEYSQYLGINVNDLIPHMVGDIQLSIPSELEFSYNLQGDIIDDAVHIVGGRADNPAQFVGITLSKKDSDVKKTTEINGGLKKYINGYTVVMTNTDNTNYAYCNYKGIWITISSVEISKDEFDIILQNIIR